MKSYKQLFIILSKNLERFVAQVKNKKSTLMTTDEWTVKDTLCHIVFWHENYAANYKAVAEHKKPSLPENMSTINARGVASLGKYPIKELMSKLQKAHQSLYRNIVEDEVPQMTYSKGGRIYQTEDFLEMISHHISTHTNQVKRAKIDRISHNSD